MSGVPKRSQIDEEYVWSIEGVYADQSEWEEAYEAVDDRIEELQIYEDRLDESAATLREFLETEESITREVQMVYQYAQLRAAEDTRDQEAQAMESRARSLNAELNRTTSFFGPELQSMDRDRLESFIDQEPALGAYEHRFDDVRRRSEHTRSPEVEAVLSELDDVLSAPGEAYSMLTNADMTFPTVDDPTGGETELTLSNFTTQLQRPNRAYRSRVHETFYEEWGEYRNTIATTLSKAVQRAVKRARIRGYDSALAATLDDSKIPPTVYNTLTETVMDNTDTLGRHTRLLGEALDVETVQPWDLYVSVTGEESPEISYERAKQLVIDAVEPLGERYQSRMAEGLDSRWVDVYETEGKRSGAFSAGTYDTQPYVLMNFQEDVSSMYTLAHELGHSMHRALTNEHQPWQYSQYDIFVAEVASTVNETLLTYHLLENVADDELRAHALDQYLERFRSVLFRQTLFAEFERRTHARAEEGAALTPDTFDEIYGELKRTFYQGDHVAVDDLVCREWMRIPHFYRNFYVYKYATGISAAGAIVDRIRSESGAADEYLNALAAGGSEYPLDTLRLAGVEMTDPDPIESAIGVYDEFLDRAESLLVS